MKGIILAGGKATRLYPIISIPVGFGMTAQDRKVKLAKTIG